MSAVNSFTENFSFNIINFDFPAWHTYEWQNWQNLDAVLMANGFLTSDGIWANNTAYTVGQRLTDITNSRVYRCLVAHTSPVSGTFAQDRTNNPSRWVLVSAAPISRGEWASATDYRVYDIVTVNTFAYYVCIEDHTSSAAFVTDSAKWQLIVDFTGVIPGATDFDDQHTMYFEDRALAAATFIPGAVAFVVTGGYASEGDRGGACYKRYGLSVPTYPGYFQSADGTYWVLNEVKPTIEMFGGSTASLSNTTALNDAHLYCAGSPLFPREIWFQTGVYIFTTKPTDFWIGVVLRGHGISHTGLLADYNEGTATNGFLTWSSQNISAVNYQCNGGGIRDLSISANTNRTLGAMVKIGTAVAGLAPGYFLYDNVYMSYGGGTSTYSFAVHISAAIANTPGGQGARSHHFRNCFIFHPSSSGLVLSTINAAGLILNNCVMNGTTRITGTNVSQYENSEQCHLVDCEFLNLELEHCSLIRASGRCTGNLSIFATAGNCDFRGQVQGTVSNASTTSSVKLPNSETATATYTFNRPVDFPQSIFFTNDITPAQITSNQNNYAPTGFSTCTTVRLTTDAARTITGLAGGTDGRIVTLFNAGGFNITLPNQSASSSAANQFYFGAGNDLVLHPGEGILLRYDAAIGIWTPIAGGLGTMGIIPNLRIADAGVFDWDGEGQLYATGATFAYRANTHAWYNYNAGTLFGEWSASGLKIVGNVGFYNTAPVARPTGVAVTAAGIHAALVTLGLITA